jgi:FANCL C-terminal domain
MTTKGKSWHRSNPRDVIKRLIAENPKAGKRFHQDCHNEWLAQQEIAARRALELDRSERE